MLLSGPQSHSVIVDTREVERMLAFLILKRNRIWIRTRQITCDLDSSVNNKKLALLLPYGAIYQKLKLHVLNPNHLLLLGCKILVSTRRQLFYLTTPHIMPISELLFLSSFVTLSEKRWKLTNSPVTMYPFQCPLNLDSSQMTIPFSSPCADTSFSARKR